MTDSYLERLPRIQITRRTLFKATAATAFGALAAPLLSACSRFAPKKDAISLAQSGGASLTDSLDPGITFLITTNLGHLFDNLVGATDDFQIRPGLAESWKAIDDVTWEFKLRKATFHNGDPVTARDVKFTI